MNNDQKELACLDRLIEDMRTYLSMRPGSERDEIMAHVNWMLLRRAALINARFTGSLARNDPPEFVSSSTSSSSSLGSKGKRKK